MAGAVRYATSTASVPAAVSRPDRRGGAPTPTAETRNIHDASTNVFVPPSEPVTIAATVATANAGSGALRHQATASTCTASDTSAAGVDHGRSSSGSERSSET